MAERGTPMILLGNFSKDDLKKLGDDGRNALIDAVVDDNHDEVERLYRTLHPMTNEEFIRTCSTEELAILLGQIVHNAYQCAFDGRTNKCFNRKNCTGYCNYGWDKWLKEKHTK